MTTKQNNDEHVKDHSPDAGKMALTPAVLERVGRYIGYRKLQVLPRDHAKMLTWHIGNGNWPIQSLNRFAADVLDKLVADGQDPCIDYSGRLADCLCGDLDMRPVHTTAADWPTAVLLAAAAVQERRE